MSKTTSNVKSQPSEDQIDDEDGGLKLKSSSTTAKMTLQPQSNFQTSKISSNNTIDSEDEDGGIRLKRRQEPKQKLQKKKTKKHISTKKNLSEILDDSMDEDGSLLKSMKSIKETKAKKKSLFFQCFHSPESNDHLHLPQKEIIKKKSINQEYLTNEDEDGGRVVKTYDTIKKLILLKQPTLKMPTTTDDSSSTGMTIINRTSADDENTKPMKMIEQETISTIQTDSSSIKTEKSITNRIHLLRTKSYQEAQDSLSLIVLEKPNGFILSCNQNHENNGNNHQTQRMNDIIKWTVKYFISLISHVNQCDEQKRKKRAQNRWCLVYSLIHNPFLANYRKQYLERNDQKQDKQQSFTSTNNNLSETLIMRRLKAKIRISPDGQCPTAVLRILPIPDTIDNRQSST